MKRIILLLISAFVLACSVMTIVGGKETDNFIKYAEFNVTADALQKAVSYDVSSQSEDTKLNYIEILSYLGAKYGGDFSKYKQSDMDNLCEKLKDGKTIAELTKDMKYYTYYYNVYTAVLSGMVGDFEEEQSDGSIKQDYGVRWFSPIAKTFPYSHYDDFGAEPPLCREPQGGRYGYGRRCYRLCGQNRLQRYRKHKRNYRKPSSYRA